MRQMCEVKCWGEVWWGEFWLVGRWVSHLLSSNCSLIDLISTSSHLLLIASHSPHHTQPDILGYVGPMVHGLASLLIRVFSVGSRIAVVHCIFASSSSLMMNDDSQRIESNWPHCEMQLVSEQSAHSSVRIWYAMRILTSYWSKNTTARRCVIDEMRFLISSMAMSWLAMKVMIADKRPSLILVCYRCVDRIGMICSVVGWSSHTIASLDATLRDVIISSSPGGRYEKNCKITIPLRNQTNNNDFNILCYRCRCRCDRIVIVFSNLSRCYKLQTIPFRSPFSVHMKWNESRSSRNRVG
jgi:hypothetical protein